MSEEPTPEAGDGSDIDPDEEGRVVRRYHLGAIAEASAHMESTPRAIFAALLGSPRATVVAAGQSVTWLTQNALAVIDTNDDVRGPSLGDPVKVARFRAAVKHYGDLYARRNQLTHGAWIDGASTPMQTISKWRKPFLVAVEVPMEAIEGLAQELEGAVAELVEASFEVKGIIAGT